MSCEFKMFRLLIVLACCYTVMCQTIDESDAEFIKWANCRSDEEFQWIHPCPGEDTCDSRHRRVLCLDVAQDREPRCVCKGGLFRADKGRCLNSEQCDKWKCPGANEHFECGDECDTVCATLDKQNKTNCPTPSYIFCKPQCYCDDGYARDEAGNCILIENCGPISSTTESNE